MPTIDTTVRQSEMIMQVANKYFGSDWDAYKKSSLIEDALETNGNFIEYNFGNLTNTLENYREEKDSFDEEFDDKISSLKKSSDDLKKLGKEGEVAEENKAAASTVQNTKPDRGAGTLSQLTQFLTAEGPPPPVEAPGEVDYTPEDVPEDVRQSLSTIKSFVRDYNSTVSYLNDKRDVSNDFSALADSFGGDKDTENSLNAIGITADSSGNLTVTSGTLARVLQETPKKVDDALGDEGLAGKLDRQINLANHNKDRLFPNIAKFAGRDSADSSESLYSIKTGDTAKHYERPEGKLLSMFA